MKKLGILSKLNLGIVILICSCKGTSTGVSAAYVYTEKSGESHRFEITIMIEKIGEGKKGDSVEAKDVAKQVKELALKSQVKFDVKVKDKKTIIVDGKEYKLNKKDLKVLKKYVQDKIKKAKIKKDK